jgi:CrcB protein
LDSTFFLRILSVGTGGFIGSVSRYLISLWLNEKYPTSLIPYGTLLVNVIGSFLLGVFMELSTYIPMNSTVRLFIATGIMGGLTTFSTLSFETMALVYDGSYSSAFLNIAVNLLLGIGSAFGGKEIVDVLFRI